MKLGARTIALLAAAAAGALCACEARKPAGGGPPAKVKIGFVVKQPEEPWFQYEWKFARQAAAELGFELVEYGAEDGEKVLARIDSLASGGAQGLVICTPDVRLGPAIVRKCATRGLKLISVDDQFVDADGKFMTAVHHLGISARKIGQSVGKALYEEMRKRGWDVAETAACVVTFDELDTARDRTEGAIESLREAGFPEERIYRAPQKYSDVPSAIDAVKVVPTLHPDVKRWLVAGMNDSAVLGAVRALEQRRFGVDTVIGIGINGTDCIVEFERAEPTGFYASMLLSAKEHGYLTSKMMYEWIAKGVEPPLDTRTIGIMITRENYQQVLKEQGIRD